MHMHILEIKEIVLRTQQIMSNKLLLLLQDQIGGAMVIRHQFLYNRYIYVCCKSLN